jgi:hypothetical protein
MKILINVSNFVVICRELPLSGFSVPASKSNYSTFTESGATQTMKTNQMAELKQ